MSGDFKIPSEFAREQDWDYDEPKTLEEVKDWAEEQYQDVPSVAPPEIGDDEDLWELAERITDDFPETQVLFGGGEHYIDTVYVVYDDVPVEPARKPSRDEFEEYAVIHFKHWMEGGPEENKGVCPMCDDRIEFSHETFRDDDNLWARPDEFDFREYENYGKTIRMWWD